MPAVDTFISPPSFTAVKLEATLAEPTQSRADAERLSDIIMEMQRCFLMHLCKELAPGNVSFSQYFLLAALDQKDVIVLEDQRHVDTTDDSAYVVVPATMTFDLKGQQITQTGAVFTVALRKVSAEWRLAAWAWAKGG